MFECGTTYPVTSSGTYYISAYDLTCGCWSNGCGSITVAIDPSANGIWSGETSNDWTDANNWSCGTVPNGNTDVIIPSGTTFSPKVTDGITVSCKSLTILQGANVIVGTNSNLNVLH